MPIGPIAACSVSLPSVDLLQSSPEQETDHAKVRGSIRDFMNKEKFQEVLKKDYGLTLEEYLHIKNIIGSFKS